MSIHKPHLIALASIITLATIGGSAAAEREAKLNGAKVGVKRSEDKFKQRLDDHVARELKCSVLSGAVGQYRISPVPGVKGQLAGCAVPKPLCFMSSVKQDEGRKDFIGSLNSRFGSSEDVNQRLPAMPECAISTTKLTVIVDVDVKSLPTEVTAAVTFKFEAKYNNAQKVTFGANNAFPKLEGTTYPRANGEVITAYANYDRAFSFTCNVQYQNLAQDVKVDLALDYAETNVHYCESDFVVADQNTPNKVDCPKK